MISRVRAAARKRRAAQAAALRRAVPVATADSGRVGAPALASSAAGPADADDLRLAHIPLRETVELVRIDLPAEELEPLLELGLMPGCRVCPVRQSPFGDPVLLVDGSLIAVRRETASCLCVRRSPEPN